MQDLSVLYSVPLEKYYHLRVLSIVDQAGGNYEKTDEMEYHSPEHGRCVVYLYTITFPPKTYRVWGERKGPVHHYTVHFPCGLLLRGSLVHGIREPSTIDMLYPA